MSILKKRNTLKLAATFILVGMMVGAFAMHTKAAFAAPAALCDPATDISGNTTPGTPNCDVAVTPNGSVGVTGLSFTSVGDVVDQTTPSVGHNTFTFAAIVTDVRDTNEGWQLQASSPGLHNTTVTHAGYFIPLTIDSGTGDCVLTTTPAPTTGTDCPIPAVTSTSITLTSTPQTFVTETPDGHPISGVSNLSIAGSYELPVGTYPGAYAGAITLSLLNTFA